MLGKEHKFFWRHWCRRAPFLRPFPLSRSLRPHYAGGISKLRFRSENTSNVILALCLSKARGIYIFANSDSKTGSRRIQIPLVLFALLKSYLFVTDSVVWTVNLVPRVSHLTAPWGSVTWETLGTRCVFKIPRRVMDGVDCFVSILFLSGFFCVTHYTLSERWTTCSHGMLFHQKNRQGKISLSFT